MLKKILLFLIVFELLAMGTVFAGVPYKVPVKNSVFKIPDLNMTDSYSGPSIPYHHSGLMDSPGIIVGMTYYDYQTNGSTGNRIAKADCGVHMCWMRGITNSTGERKIYYNYIDPDGNLGFGSEGTAASSNSRDGYTTLAVDSTGAALVAYHYATDTLVIVGVDAGCGFGLFTDTYPDNKIPGYLAMYWPYISYDRQGNMQLTETEPVNAGDAGIVGHTYSTDMGSNWIDAAIYYDQAYNISGIVTSSPVSDKSAIVFTLPADDGTAPGQVNQDVGYIESTDGTTWDYGNIVNITNHRNPSTGDTLRAYTDVDAIYDYNDNLHIIWNEHGYWDSTWTPANCYLWHWSEATGKTLVYDAWHFSYPGAWNHTASKMSIAADDNGNLFALWTNFDSLDVSSGGYSNGELYLAYSTDDGVTWSDPVNITNTNSEGCLPGDCYSEHWSSLAEKVDDSLYIEFIEDKDAGGIPQNEGIETENPVRYLAIAVSDIIITGVEDGDNELPSQFALNQNYPNPFNATTNITFTVKKASNVKLDIYNLLGQKVSELVNGKLSAGEHTFTWDASGMTSGIYFYKLSANGNTITKRMTLMK